MDLRELGEREAIRRLRHALGDTEDLGMGVDDCAVYPLAEGRLLLASTDVVAGHTHILPGTTPEMLGSFVVELTISDVAAMGGIPIGLLTALAMPPGADIEWLEGLATGMAQATERHGVTVMGGDTKASSEPTVAATALGMVDEEACLFRRGGRPGDILVLTGAVGGPAMGYFMPRNPEGDLTPEALGMVYGVRARVEAGESLGFSGHARACIDLSDGLAPALHQLQEASGCGAKLSWEDIPLAEGLEALCETQDLDLEATSLHWGGEYELLTAVDPLAVQDVLEDLKGLGLEPAVVGHLTDGHETLLVRDGSPAPLSPQGFDHFQG
jgi:thiamine-monophosphate kinase